MREKENIEGGQLTFLKQQRKTVKVREREIRLYVGKRRKSTYYRDRRKSKRQVLLKAASVQRKKTQEH